MILAAAVLAMLPVPALRAQEGRAEARAREERAAAAAERGWMGVQFSWREEGDDEAVVAMVFPRSSAEAAGLRRGDVVLRIDGRAADSGAVDALRESLKPGGVVVLTVRDGDRTRDVRVTATARPAGEALAERVIHLRRDRDGVVFDTIITGDVDVRVLEPMREALRLAEGDTAGRRRYVFRYDTEALKIDSLRGRMDSLRTRVLRMEPGRALGFEIEMDGHAAAEERRTYERVVTGAMEEGGPLPFFLEMGRRSLAGAELAEMNEGLGRYFRVDDGLLVLAVSPGTPAARAGLEAGDVIVEVEGDEVHDVTAFRRAVAGAEDGDVTLDVVRQGRRRELTMQWERVRAVRVRGAPRASGGSN
jgi:predicted metalloprotease with PDZ domain